MKFYLSHAIRGKAGNGASKAEQEANCRKAVGIGGRIKQAIIAAIEIYVPGDQTEQFVSIAYKKGYITESQILDVDCAIIDNCDALLLYIPEGDVLQGGRLIEYNHAVSTSKPICSFADVNQAVAFITKLILE